MTQRPRIARDEAARILGLPASSLHHLFDGDSIAADQLECILRDSLLRLYRAESTPRIAAAEPPQEFTMTEDEVSLDLPEAETIGIVRSIAEYENELHESKPEHRIGPRYIPRRQINGTFRSARFTLLQLSSSGLRVRHDETLRAGDVARMTLTLVRPARTFAMQARVVWTSIAQRGEDPSFCISGLRITEGDEQLRLIIEILRGGHELQTEAVPAPRRVASPAAITGMSDEDVASIIRAVKKLGSDPVEANRWYVRARFALVEESVRQVAPVRARDREEVIAVWEYLERRLEIKQVAGVVGWLRQTRTAAAVA